jgi:hypothetical protein
MKDRVHLAVAAFLLAAWPSLAAAQGGATLAGGLNRHHIQGASGTDWVVTARLAFPLGPYTLAEPGLTFLRWHPIIGTKITYLIPELSIQAQGYVGPVRPYAGAGIGFSTPSRGGVGVSQEYLTLHVAGGFRWWVSRTWAIRTELRARSIDPFSGTTLDFLVGVTQGAARRGM